MSDHIPCDVLSELAHGVLPAERISSLLPHLIRCSRCLVSFLSAGRLRARSKCTTGLRWGHPRAFEKVRALRSKPGGEGRVANSSSSRARRLSALPVITKAGRSLIRGGSSSGVGPCVTTTPLRCWNLPNLRRWPAAGSKPECEMTGSWPISVAGYGLVLETLIVLSRTWMPRRTRLAMR